SATPRRRHIPVKIPTQGSRPGRLVAATACPGRHETPGAADPQPQRPEPFPVPLLRPASGPVFPGAPGDVPFKGNRNESSVRKLWLPSGRPEVKIRMSRFNVTRVTAEVGDSTISFETGKLAKQASGAVVVRSGDTMVLNTATIGGLRDVD